MASRTALTPVLFRRFGAAVHTHAAAPLRSARGFQTSARRLEDVSPLATRKPVGAFRGGLLGFFLGSTMTGAGIYYYVLDEYKVSNELLMEDIYALQAAVQRVHLYVETLEEKLDGVEKGRK